MHTLSPYSGPPSARAAAKAAASWWAGKRAALNDVLQWLAATWPAKAAAGIAGALTREQNAKQAAAELKNWDAHMLRDIGIERMEIDAAVRGELKIEDPERPSPWRD